MPNMVFFEDGRGDLGPLTDLRHACRVRTGAATTRERWMRLPGFAHEQVVDVTLASEATVEFSPDDPVWLINGRCVMPPIADLAGVSIGEAYVDPEDESVLVARLPPEVAAAFLQTGALPDDVAVERANDPRVLRNAWDVITHRDVALKHDLDVLVHSMGMAPDMPPAVIGVGERIAIADGAGVWPTVVIDATSGPVVIERGATVRPGAIICGPAWIGPNATVLERTLVKAGSAIGPHCKVAGEVGGTIFQGYANKAHDGHLGDAWVGAWANLGAGTTNSNLLNTYAEVTMQVEPGGRRRRTGLTFLGCLVGDHAKCAIGTRIMTGTVLGTGAMIASTAPPPTCVPRFAWLTDAGMSRYRFSKFLDVARTVMARRDVELDDATVERLKALHDAGGDDA